MITLQILLIIINVLILTGFGQYSHHQGRKQSLMLTIDKWIYSNSSSLPLTFSRMILSGQYIASAFSVLLLTSTVFLEYIHLKRGKNPRFLVGITWYLLIFSLIHALKIKNNSILACCKIIILLSH